MVVGWLMVGWLIFCAGIGIGLWLQRAHVE